VSLTTTKSPEYISVSIDPDKTINGFHPKNDGTSSGLIIEPISITPFIKSITSNIAIIIMLIAFFIFAFL